jgi:hypothetical protein
LVISALMGSEVNPTTRMGRGRFTYPASHAQNAVLDPRAIPLGARLRLKNSDASQAKVDAYSAASPAYGRVLKALQQYGLIVADGGGDLDMCGTYDPRWNSVGQDWVNAFRFGTGVGGTSKIINWTDFELIVFGWPNEPGVVH